MKKQLVVRQPKKKLLVRRPSSTVKAISGTFKGVLVRLVKRGFSGWFAKRVDNGEEIYLFVDEVP